MLFVIPLSLSASSVASILRTADDVAVTRGEFVQAAVTLFSTPSSRITLPYRRIPKALESAAASAYALKALEVFGSEFYPARSITRGEALYVVMKLQKVTAKPTTVFRDAKAAGEAIASAVQAAVSNGWMEPQSATQFGVTDTLMGIDARLLLRKVLGEGGIQNGGMTTDGIPTIQIKLNPGISASSQLPKGQILQNLWGIIQSDYLHTEKIQPDVAAYDAAEALVNSLDDPYSVFYRPQKAQDFNDRINGEVSGIGAQVEESKDGLITVVTPITGSPAEKAGIKPGDLILSVDGVSLKGLSVEDAVAKIRGPVGTTVKLTISRNGNQFDLSVVRDVVKVPEISISWQGNVAVVKLAQFGKLTDSDLRAQMEKIQLQNPTGMILDLRNNPGGLLHAADTVCANFLPKGSVVAQIKARSGTTTEQTDDDPSILPSVPLVVLVNKGSASAAEIVAGALQDAGRAKIVGEQSFGKGTVQEVLEFSDRSSLKLTIAEWFTPNGRAINGKGVTPDVVVTSTGDRDEQMSRALLILQGGR